MNLADIQLKISSISNVDETVYTDDLQLIDINIWQHKVQAMIENAMDEVDFDDNRYSDYPELTTPLVSGQRDYTIPTSEKVVSIKRVDISYDGINYYRAQPLDTGEILTGLGPSSATTQQTSTDSYFPKTTPRYDVAYNSVFIYPAPLPADAVNGKIFIEWNREIKEFTSADMTAGTAIPGFDTAFHSFLAYGPAREFLLGTGQDTSQCDEELKILGDLLTSRYGKKQLDRDNTLVPYPVCYK